MPHTDVDAVGMAHQFEKPHHVVKVVQRLSGTHQHDVGHLASAVLLGEQDLVQDLRGRQVAASGRVKGGTEYAAHLAAGLRGHADAVAVFIFHQHGLDAVAVGQAE